MKTKISAQIVAHSVNEQGDELISVLATFPRIILAEVNTHRMLSKNTSSSRAIPFNKMVETIQNDPFIPIAWQKEHKGMQGSEYHIGEAGERLCPNNWLRARDRAVVEANHLHDNIGVTKQLANRLLEPFMWTTMLITGPKSGWENFFKLRCPNYMFHDGDTEEDKEYSFRSKKDAINHFSSSMDVEYETGNKFLKDLNELDWLKLNTGQAEIHMMELAECIWDAYNKSTPLKLKAGDWHIPFEDKIDLLEESLPGEKNTSFRWNISQNTKIPLKVLVSVALSARTSYTVVGEEKALDYEALIGLHDRLLAWDPPHSSPLEHCAQAMTNEEYWSFFGTTAQNTKGNGWCNNFKGFIPYRYMVDNGNQETKDQDFSY